MTMTDNQKKNRHLSRQIDDPDNANNWQEL